MRGLAERDELDTLQLMGLALIRRWQGQDVTWGDVDEFTRADVVADCRAVLACLIDAGWVSPAAYAEVLSINEQVHAMNRTAVARMVDAERLLNTPCECGHSPRKGAGKITPCQGDAGR